MTQYNVFRQVDDDGNHWRLVGTYEGRTPKDAVEDCVLNLADDEQAGLTETMFAACAVSKWYELSPTVETETRVRFA